VQRQLWPDPAKYRRSQVLTMSFIRLFSQCHSCSWCRYRGKTARQTKYQPIKNIRLVLRHNIEWHNIESLWHNCDIIWNLRREREIKCSYVIRTVFIWSCTCYNLCVIFFRFVSVTVILVIGFLFEGNIRYQIHF
jgi:hypothetical protein